MKDIIDFIRFQVFSKKIEDYTLEELAEMQELLEPISGFVEDAIDYHKFSIPYDEVPLKMDPEITDLCETFLKKDLLTAQLSNKTYLDYAQVILNNVIDEHVTSCKPVYVLSAYNTLGNLVFEVTRKNKIHRFCIYRCGFSLPFIDVYFYTAVKLNVGKKINYLCDLRSLIVCD